MHFCELIHGHSMEKSLFSDMSVGMLGVCMSTDYVKCSHPNTDTNTTMERPEKSLMGLNILNGLIFVFFF